jgi:hypothetical protein
MKSDQFIAPHEQNSQIKHFQIQHSKHCQPTKELKKSKPSKSSFEDTYKIQKSRGQKMEWGGEGIKEK